MAKTSARARRKKRMMRRIRKVTDMLLVAVILCCAVYLVGDYLNAQNTINKANSIKGSYYSALAQSAEEDTVEANPVETKQEVTVTEEETEVELIAPEAPNAKRSIKVSGESLMQDQFIKLYEANNDLVAWLKVNDEVEYPVVWRDNMFYMDHDYYGKYDNAGWIFLDERNDSTMSDDALLIYGHNMKYGEMFGKLDKYEKKDYLRANPIIELQPIWMKEPKEYVIFALADASMNPDHSSYVKITEFNFETDEEKEQYIAALRESSIYDIPIETDANDQIVLLITCNYTYPNGRLIIVGRELREGETAEGIRAMFSGK